MASILVIDDNDVVRETIGRFLKPAGHTIIEAENGQAAQGLLDTMAIDLVITDIFMPEKEGLEVIRELRRAGRPVAIIAISGGGGAGPDVLQIARELGADATLPKPFSRERLLEAVDTCLAGDARS